MDRRSRMVAIGGGYRTSIIGVNAGATSVNAEISFLKAAKPPCGSTGQGCAEPFQVTVSDATASTFTKTVAAMGTIRLDATSAGSVASGYASFKSDEELNGIALFQTASQRFPASIGPGFEGTIEFDAGRQSPNARAVALRYDNPSQDVFTTVPVILNVPDQNEVTRGDPAHPTTR